MTGILREMVQMSIFWSAVDTWIKHEDWGFGNSTFVADNGFWQTNKQEGEEQALHK